MTDDLLVPPAEPPAAPGVPSTRIEEAQIPSLNRPDRSRPEPLWHQVAQTLSATIEEGIWSPGDQLPGEERLCEMLGVSRITIRHALRKLEDQGVVRKEHGRGTFVRSSRLVGGAQAVTSFSREMAELGRTPGSVLLDIEVVLSDARTTSALELSEPQPVLRIRRLRTGDGEPIGIQTAHLLRDVVPDLEGHELAHRSLYDLLRERYGVVPTAAHEVYRVGTATPEEAAILEIEPGTPVFVVLRVANSESGPFEFTTSTMRADRYEIRTTLTSP
jgi:GntR family transcriptional regulator